MNEPANKGGTGEEPTTALTTTAKGRFQKGTSGNPLGRPKTPPEVKEALLAALPQAVDNLISIANTAPKIADRIRANEIIIERVLGKAAQPLTGPDGEGPVQVAALVVLPAPSDE